MADFLAVLGIIAFVAGDARVSSGLWTGYDASPKASSSASPS